MYYANTNQKKNRVSMSMSHKVSFRPVILVEMKMAIT